MPGKSRAKKTGRTVQKTMKTFGNVDVLVNNITASYISGVILPVLGGDTVAG